MTVSTSDDVFLRWSVEKVLKRLKASEGWRFDSDAAKGLGMDRRALAGYKSRGTLPFEQLAEFAAQHDYSLEWVINGRGPQQLAELDRIAEPAARYGGGVNFELHSQVAEAVHELLDEAGIKVKNEIDQAKVDYLIAYCYNDIAAQGGKVDRDKIRATIKLAM